MALSDIELEIILLNALESPLGITVTTNNPDMLKKQCYSLRNKARKQNNAAYDVLSFRTSPVANDSELWIIKKTGDSDNAKS